MIEVRLTQQGGEWEVGATIHPHGGLGIAQDATLANISAPSFAQALRAVETLSEATFTPNPERWPSLGPQFKIINQMSHPDHEHFGNYKIMRGKIVIGTISDFPRGNPVELIREAIRIVSELEK